MFTFDSFNVHSSQARVTRLRFFVSGCWSDRASECCLDNSIGSCCCDWRKESGGNGFIVFPRGKIVRRLMIAMDGKWTGDGYKKIWREGFWA